MTLKKRILTILLSLVLVLGGVITASIASAKGAENDSFSYTADFSKGLPSDWSESSFGETDYIYEPKKTTDGVEFGYDYASNNPAESEYYGAFYKIAESLGNVKDFTLQMTFKTVAYKDTSRWFGVLYRTQTATNGKVCGYMMNYRFQGKSAASAVTATPSFNDSMAIETGIPTLTDTAVAHTLKIVVSGTTATHYMDNVQVMSFDLGTQTKADGTATFSNILGATYAQGGFALIVNNSTINITGLTISGTKGTPNQNKTDVTVGGKMQYYADFQNGLPSDWELYNKCDTANTASPVVTDNGIKLQNQTSADTSLYYGSVYNIAKNLGNVKDFTMEMRYRVTSTVNGTRWVGLLYHTQQDSNGYMSGYMMNYRYGEYDSSLNVTRGASAESAVSGSASGIYFNDGTKKYQGTDRITGENSNLPPHDGTQYITLKIVVKDGYATHYVDDLQTVSYLLADKEGYMGQTLLEGGFSLVINQCTIEIDSLTIVGIRGNDVAESIKSVPTYMNSAPAIVYDVDSTAEYNSMKDSKADSVIVTANEALNVIDSNNAVIDTLSNAIGLIRDAIAVPIVRVKNATAGTAVATYLNANGYTDISVMANDTSVVKTMRDIAPSVRGMVDWSNAGDVNDQTFWLKIVQETNKAKANVAVLSKTQATLEAVTFIQERLKTVWTVAGEFNEYDTVEMTVSGTFGIITNAPTSVYGAYSKFSGETAALLRAPLNIAHRGLSYHYLENSLSGFKAAVDNYGASHLEVDAHLTKDNQLVMMHDDCLVRTTNISVDCGYEGNNKNHWTTGACPCCSDYTLAEIQALSIDKTYDGVVPPMGPATEKVPSVDEVFDYFKDKDVVYAFEIKHSKNDDASVTAIVTALKALLDKYNNYDQVFVITFNETVIAKMGELLPQVPVANLNTTGFSCEGWGKLAELNCVEDIGGNLNIAETLKKRGYMPFFWTYQRQADIDTAMLSHGCYGVTNNEAHLIADYAEKLEIGAGQNYLVANFNGNNLAEQQDLRFYSYGNTYSDTKADVFAIEKVGDYANVIFKAVYTTNTNKSYTIYSKSIKVIDKNIYISVNDLNVLLAKDVSAFDENDKAKLAIAKRAYAALDASEQALVVGIENVDLKLEQLNTFNVSLTNDDNKGVVTGLENPYANGATTNISITAKAGYRISSITYDGGQISVTNENAMVVQVQVTKDANLVIAYEAIPSTPSYQISVTNDSAKGVISGVTDGMTVLQNQSVSFSVNAKDGYYISSITFNGGNISVPANATSFAYTINSVTQNGALVVNYAQVNAPIVPQIYSVSATIDGTKGYITGVEIGVPAYLANANLNAITITAKTGFDIDTVKWNGGAITVTNAKSFTLPAQTVNGDCTLEVTFKPSTYKVTISLDTSKGNLSGIDGVTNYTHGQIVSNITITPKANYEIASVTWNGVPVTITNRQQVVIASHTFTENCTLEVVFNSVEATKYQVTVTNDNDKGAVSGIATAEYEEGAAISNVTITAKTGYKIKSVKWNGVSETIVNEKTLTLSTKNINQVTTLVVEYEELNFAVSVTSDNDKGTVTGVTSGQTFQEGSTLSNVTITAKTGYIVKSVKWNGGNEAVTANCKQFTLTTKIILDASTLVVEYEALNFSVSLVNDNACGSVLGLTGGASFQEGATLSNVTITAKTGYKIKSVKWNGESQAVDAKTFILPNKVITENSTLEIVYEEVTFTVTITNDSSKGTVSAITSGAYAEGSVLSNIKITAKDGYKIVSVKWNGVSEIISNDKEITLSAKTVTAKSSLEVVYELIPTTPTEPDLPTEPDTPSTPNTPTTPTEPTTPAEPDTPAPTEPAKASCFASVNVSGLLTVAMLCLVMAIILCVKNSKKEND